MAKRIHQSGAVSLFAVIFAAMLMTIITVGFIKLMIMDQRQATSNDLSQSAYDAALAGVEDAKRVVRAAQLGNTAAISALEKPGCDTIARSGVAGAGANGETVIKTGSAAGVSFDQAYTCVKISMESPDFLYKAVEEKTQLIPLRATNSFTKVILEWYKRDDESNVSGADAKDTALDIEGSLPTKASWGGNTPSLLRAQIIHPGDSFTDVRQLDATGVTAFLRPRVLSSEPSLAGTSLDARLAVRPRTTGDQTYNSNDVNVTACSKTFRFSGEYSCRAVIGIDTVRAGSNNAFLRLNSIYKGASVKVSLQNDAGQTINFDGVQPIVDSTGRASNLFRRVEARLNIGDDFPYPENAVELKNSLCKDFSVTDNTYQAGACRP